MERESSKECSVSFLWTNESFSLLNGLSRNSTLFSSRLIRALRLFWRVFEPTEAARFLKKLEVHFVYSMIRESTFFKGKFLYIYKGFMNIFYILTSAWKNMHFKLIFLPCAQSIILSYPRSSKCYAICFLGLTYGFWNKNFQVIKLFICHCSFKTLAQNTIVRLQIVRFLETLQTGCSPFLN